LATTGDKSDITATEGDKKTLMPHVPGLGCCLVALALIDGSDEQTNKLKTKKCFIAVSVDAASP